MTAKRLLAGLGVAAFALGLILSPPIYVVIVGGILIGVAEMI